MAPVRFAFPVFDKVSLTSSPVLTDITCDVLPFLENALLSSKKAVGPLTHKQAGLACLYRIGSEIAIPLTFIGTPSNHVRGCAATPGDLEQIILMHSPGLAGAFGVPLSILLSCRGQFVADDAAVSVESRQLGSLCLMEVVQASSQTQKGFDIMDKLYLKGRRRHFSAQGVAHLIAREGQINPDALRLDFPYHAGGAHALKCYMDITEEACRHFCAHADHGTKVLSRYGSAVCVGVAVDKTLGTSCLYWHPYGAQAACIAPILHGCRLLPVGKIKVQLNGPTPYCNLIHREDVRRYMNIDVEGLYDSSAWLCEGLFGVRSGQQWRGSDSTRVLGVGFNEAAEEFELVLKDVKSQSVFFADDLV